MIKSQHYLEQWAEQAVEEGERDWNTRKDKESAYDEITKAPKKTRTEAYCMKCGDSKLRGVKATNKYGIDTNGERFITDDWAKGRCTAYYIGKCSQCGGTLTKRITNKGLDAYFKRSKKVIRARNQYRLDILQPNDEGYNALYGSYLDQLETGNIHNIKQLEEVL